MKLKKIVVENKIPFIAPLVAGLADETVFLAPEKIDAAAVADADALVVRTRTRCDAALLEGSDVKFIATATIGTDHIDSDYCRLHNIAVANAPGCNAPAVAQWVWRSILALSPELKGLTIGVVGVGHVGSIVARWGDGLGLNVLRCDPPRQQREGPEGFVALNEIAEKADIITFHTPLDETTRHLADSEFFDSLGRRPLIINAARGPVTDTGALIGALNDGRVRAAAIDCWEGEPAIDRRLLETAYIATPHIAGYSAEGKLRATLMAVEALRRHIGLEPGDASSRVLPVPERVTADDIIASYDIMADTAALKQDPGAFERLRNSYQLRHEINPET